MFQYHVNANNKRKCIINGKHLDKIKEKSKLSTYYYILDDQEILNELFRYIDDPGQALSYKIGELILHKLKKEYLKKNKNIKDFHKRVLDIGPCPWSIFIDEFYSYGKI